MEIQIIAGFLGVGKTTFLNKYLPLLSGKTVVIENEFGEIGIDGQLIEEDVPVKEIYAGCICCSLAMDFRKGIKEIEEKFQPDRILIEPSGVGRLSDIVKACEKARETEQADVRITKLITIVDAEAFEEYAEEFGAFYLDQIENATMLFLSNSENLDADKKSMLVTKLKEFNSDAVIYDSDWRLLQEKEFMDIIQTASDFEADKKAVTAPSVPAGKVFSSIAVKHPRKLERERLIQILEILKQEEYGYVLRGKGTIQTPADERIYFDYTPFAAECRESLETENAVVFIGCNLKETALRKLFESDEY